MAKMIPASSSPTQSARRGRPTRLVRLARFECRRVARFFQGKDRGATSLEMLLLLAAIALPGYVIIQTGLQTLFAHYRLVTTINGLPFP